MKYCYFRTFSRCGLILATLVITLSQSHASDDPATGTQSRNLAVTSDAQSAVSKSGPIKDSIGRIRYIVDLFDDHKDKPAKFRDAGHKLDYHKTKSAQLIAEVSKLRGEELLGTTSLVGTSFTAYLTEKQVEQFAKDKRVKLVTQDVYLRPSALWNSTNDYYPQVRPWGLHAMDVAWAGPSNGSATVYVLDTGVEMHPDLPGLSAGDRLSAFAGINPTGCYAHGTHVAGIIGAADNGTGVVGVLPGVRIVSIALGSTNPAICPAGSTVAYGSDDQTADALGQALQKVYELAIYEQRVPIVNISFNQAASIFASTGTIGLKMSALATSSFYDGAGYRGAFIVQSAGNSFADACAYAYGPAAAYDGIMVVGGLDENGQPVSVLNDLAGYSPPFDRGSNDGGCVEVWAPSQRVLSTWPGGTFTLAGTSMAAPHIAGFAARLVESDPGINTSDQLEAAVRARFTTISGSNLAMPRLSLQHPTALPTIEVVEGTSRSSVGPINFNKLPAEVDLRFDSVGAQYCRVIVTRNGVPGTPFYTSPRHNLGVNAYVPGQYSWSITCFSPQGTQTTVVADGYLKRPVSVAWRISTTSTGFVHQVIPHGGSVFWSVPNNASFDMANESTGADFCHILVYGFYGNPRGDIENPAYFTYSTSPPFYSQSYPYPGVGNILLYDSGPYFSTYFQQATFYFGHPQPYEGYKWKLTCRNSDVAVTTVVYGKPQQ